MRKFAGILILGQLILSVFFVAPYIQFHDAQVKNPSASPFGGIKYTLEVTNASQSPTTVNVTLPQQSPDDQAAIADFQEAYRTAGDDPDSLIRLMEFENSSTNESLKSFEAARIKEFLHKIETNAAQKMIEIRAGGKFDNDVQAIDAYLIKNRVGNVPFMSPLSIDFKPDQTNEMIAYCLRLGESRNFVTTVKVSPAVWFLAIREEAGENFEMYDYAAVQKWMEQHPVKPEVPKQEEPLRMGRYSIPR